ncbi:auxin efflux carrier component 2-like protein [Cinnamomum micranthum f. kanehirae]|uniref:Auxin efflux carrier component 2-like protein n=1 Tax=Cinnamomum micranthum f. kanehirae TaxID=337451 RepID=A0A443NVW2_9MAGN|nr:auxin efflux carrier component 2-like protein [Cinnamomum micranthum f. kanehirae]
MITGKAIYDVLTAIVPLHVAMILGYGSVKWWKIFTPDQCSGINRFVAVFAVPLLSFHFISSNDPYTMNYRFITADTLQKLVILILLFLWQAFLGGSGDWVITLFSLSTLPNTLVVGIPLLKSMYGDFSASLMVQVVVLQSVVWYTLLIILFEYRGGRALISEQFPNTAASIASLHVDPDVSSLSGWEPLEVDAEISEDGSLHVVLKRFSSPTDTQWASDLSGVEIYSVKSSRLSSLDQMDLLYKFPSRMASPRCEGNWNGKVRYMRSASASAASSTWNLEEEVGRGGSEGGGRNMSSEVVGGSGGGGYLNEVVYDGLGSGGKRKEEGGDEGFHMFVWSSSASPVSHADSRAAASIDFEASNACKALVPQGIGASRGHGRFHESIGYSTPITKSRADREIEREDGHQIPRKLSIKKSPFLGQKTIDAPQGENMNGAPPQMPSASIMTRLVLIMVWRKLIRNPNTYASLIGIVWSLVSFRWKIEMPSILQGSISIISKTGLGMAMFSLGLFMALQPKMIACGRSVAVFSMAVRFVVGPAVMAATSAAIGISGVLLQVSIVQAALPEGIVPFVFAKEYNCNADILSTSVIFGLIIALPAMITGKAIYDVVTAIVPLYVAMILGYGSVKWWKIFTPDQCSGINRFVAVFAVPLLSFNLISSNDPYTMNFRFIAADTLQKLVILILLFLWRAFLGGSGDWGITLFSLSTLPNTLVVGIPLLTSMYGDFSASLMVQVVVLQSVVWYTLLIILFEYRGGRALISKQFPNTAASIASFHVEPEVSSLSGREPLEVDAEISEDGSLHVVLKRFSSPTDTRRASDLSGVEIYSVQSSRLSSLDQIDDLDKFPSRMVSPRCEGNWNGKVRYMRSASASASASSTWNLEEEMGRGGSRNGKGGGRNMISEVVGGSGGGGCLNEVVCDGLGSGGKRKEEGGDEGFHMFMWSSSASPVSHAVSRAASSIDFEVSNACKALVPQPQGIGASKDVFSFAFSKGHVRFHESIGHSTPMTKSRADREIEIEDGRQIPRKLSRMKSIFLGQKTIDPPQGENTNGAPPQMPPASVMTRLILIMVWRKLIRNPNTYASVIGIVWSLVSFRWKIKMPAIIQGSISIISKTGLGMAMFSLGLFMALQPKMIACGRSVAAFSMAIRFVVGPAVMAATSTAIGIRGVLLQVSIVQAALPEGIVPFVFAKEYNCHADILSTS